MRTHEEIIEHLIKRYIVLELLINYYYQKSIELEDQHKRKEKKLCDETISEYQAEQREVIRTYAFIFDLSFIDSCGQLREEYVKEMKERGDK